MTFQSELKKTSLLTRKAPTKKQVLKNSKTSYFVHRKKVLDFDWTISFVAGQCKLLSEQFWTV